MSSIPPTADQVLANTSESGDRTYECVLEGRLVGRRFCDAAGHLLGEYGLKDGLRHGVERRWDPEGHLEFESYWEAGLEHGTATQWVKGRVVGTYHLDHGTGVDLWRTQACAGRTESWTLSEERHCEQGERHGFERWWNGDDATVYLEGHYWRGERHGIFREWNSRGRLCRGFPRYLVHDLRVTKPQYLKAAATDPLLPPFVEADNTPQRPLPREYVKQR